MNHLINVPHTNLVRHERNMRRRYPLASVRRMGLSQVARVRLGSEPCVQPLIVTLGPGMKFNPSKHDPLKTKFIIIAGHRRHAGNAWLGKDAPLLNCIVRYYPDEATMLAEMSTENGNREEPSYLEWALHFKQQLDADSRMNIPMLARLSGKSRNTVDRCMDLLKLCPDAQRLIDAGDLQFSSIQYLLKVQDHRAQARIARQLARPGTRLETIKTTVSAYLADRVESAKPKRQGQAKTRPAIDSLPKILEVSQVPAASGQAARGSLGDVRETAAVICAGCNISGRLKLKEPAYHIAIQAAGDTCDECGLQKVKGACADCPLAEMMARLARKITNNAKS